MCVCVCVCVCACVRVCVCACVCASISSHTHTHTQVMKVVCMQLLEAAKPGGALSLIGSQKPLWRSMAVGVPECFSPAQRAVVQVVCVYQTKLN